MSRAECVHGTAPSAPCPPCEAYFARLDTPDPPLPLDAPHAEGEAPAFPRDPKAPAPPVPPGVLKTKQTAKCSRCGHQGDVWFDYTQLMVQALNDAVPEHIEDLEAALTAARAEFEGMRDERDALAARLDAVVRALNTAGEVMHSDRFAAGRKVHCGLFERCEVPPCSWVRAALASARAGEGGS